MPDCRLFTILRRAVRQGGIGLMQCAVSFPPAAIATTVIAVLAFVADQAEPAPRSAPATTQPAPSLQVAGELWLEGYYDRAEQQYGTLAADAETALQARVGLARCGLMTGRYAEALAKLDRVAEEGDRAALWHTVRAELLARVGRYEEAIRHVRRALEVDPQHHRARHLLGRFLERAGRREEAIEVYAFFDRLMSRRMPVSAEGITEAAQGFYRYTVLTRHPNLVTRTRHVLQEFLQMAYEKVDRNWWPARLAAADLLRSKYKPAQASEDYRGALRINNNLPDAQVGLGCLALDAWQFEEVERRVDKALETNPRFVPALNLRARSQIQERRYAEALETCEQALQINPHHVEALSLAAAACRCRYDLETTRRYQELVQAINPRCATFYAILGDALSGLRQYAEGEAAYLKSIEYEPTDPNPRTELGLLYMQWGREDQARQALDASWALDEFNERTYNTLELLKKLESFAREQTEHFTILYDEELDWAIAPYLASIAEEAYDDICTDYETDLPQKTIIEVFPTHRDFGVRITAKPWIHTVGACTGWVIALESPRPHPETSGPYHYGQVLRHEFTHTLTLALTGNRIPHWFTEGLAVASEDSPRSFHWSKQLADALRRDRLFTLESIDWGFIRPRRPGDRQMAYAQSEWMVEYLIQRFGYDVLGRMLGAFGQAQPQEQVFREVLGMEPATYDADFAAWARSQAEGWGFDLTPPENLLKLRAAVLVQPGDAALRARLAKAELDDGNLDRALEAARKAIELDDRHPVGLTVLVEALAGMAQEEDKFDERRRLEDEALPAGRRLAEVDPDGWTAPKVLGDVSLRRKDYDEAVRWFKRLQRLCPTDPVSYRGLAGIYLDRDQSEAALPQLLELARMDEHDAEVPAKIAAIFAARDRLPEARYWYSQSLLVDPFEPQTHQKLAEVLMRTGDTGSAVTEYEVLCRMEPEKAQHFSNAAFAYKKLGDAENARRCATKAVELESTSPARTLLDDSGR